MPKRIVLHTPEPTSGAARYLYELARGLHGAGVDVGLVCPGNFQFSEHLREIQGIGVFPAAPRSIETQRKFFRKVVSNLYFLVSMMKVQMRVVGPGDIIHFQYPLHYPFGTVFFLQAALQRARIVFTVHDPIPHKWLLPKWLRWIDYAALTISYRMSSYLIVHSEPGRRMLIDTFGKPASRVVVIPHGPYRLDGEVLSRNSTDCIELLMFGSLRENKGIHLAIGAVQMLYRGGAKVHLTIAGEVLNGSERAYWDVCRALIAEAPAPISLRKGFVPDEELPELFSQCDYVLMPYINFVSDSGVASMALANGRPMIATRTGGLGILLAQADVGFAIEEATVEGVAAAIENALAGGIETARRKGRTAAQHIDQFCGWGLISKHTAELYQVLLSGGHPALPVWQTPSASQERV